MTMYLPNPELHPTGAEPGEFADEFIETHHAGEPGDRTGTSARNQPRQASTVHLDTQTRLDITRWAEEYIVGLVESRHGDRDDVRAVIHDLHRQANLFDAPSKASP